MDRRTTNLSELDDPGDRLVDVAGPHLESILEQSSILDPLPTGSKLPTSVPAQASNVVSPGITGQMSDQIHTAVTGNEELPSQTLRQRQTEPITTIFSEDKTLSSNSTFTTSYQGPKIKTTSTAPHRQSMPELVEETTSDNIIFNVINADIESVSSADSGLFSTNDATPSNSTLAKVRDVAIKYLIRKFTEDAELSALYKHALAKMPINRFVCNLERLLKMYFILLGTQDKTSKERQAITSWTGGAESDGLGNLSFGEPAGSTAFGSSHPPGN